MFWRHSGAISCSIYQCCITTTIARIWMPNLGHLRSMDMSGSRYSSLQNVADLDEISSGQTSRIGAGLRIVGIEAGKSEAEIERDGKLGAALCTRTRKMSKKTMTPLSAKKNVDVENDEKSTTSKSTKKMMTSKVAKKMLRRRRKRCFESDENKASHVTKKTMASKATKERRRKRRKGRLSSSWPSGLKRWNQTLVPVVRARCEPRCGRPHFAPTRSGVRVCGRNRTEAREREWAEGTMSSLPGTLNVRIKFCHSTGIARSGGGVRASTTSYA